MANDSPYGLQSAVFTQDINKAFDIAYRLEAGGVIVNWSSALRVETLPFGGIKMSGHGREGIHDTLEEMTEQKTIVIHNAFPAAVRQRRMSSEFCVMRGIHKSFDGTQALARRRFLRRSAEKCMPSSGKTARASRPW